MRMRYALHVSACCDRSSRYVACTGPHGAMRILLYIEQVCSMYVSSYWSMYVCVLILLYVCVRILLYVRHQRGILLYIEQVCSMYVSSYCSMYVCVLMLLYVCVRILLYARHQRGRVERPMSIAELLVYAKLMLALAKLAQPHTAICAATGWASVLIWPSPSRTHICVPILLYVSSYCHVSPYSVWRASLHGHRRVNIGGKTRFY
jgi:hypothetical protein